jgi:hypothetical protein
MQFGLLDNRPRLESDLLNNLARARPALFDLYPLPYLRWIVHDTLDIAAPWHFDDVYALRTFLLLRFDIAPGLHKPPRIAAVLQDRNLGSMQRWERLAQPEFADAWLDALRFNGPAEWRAGYWKEPA